MSPPFRPFNPPPSVTTASGEALLMHAALLAQSRGMKGFALFPARHRLDAVFVRFGNPGEAGMPAAATFDAAAVVKDLSGEFPDPNVKPSLASH